MTSVRLEIDFGEGTPFLVLKTYCEACDILVTSRQIDVRAADEDFAAQTGEEDAKAFLSHLKTCKGSP